MRGLRIAVEGCGHGTLNSIYASIAESCKHRGWDGVDLLLIGGDFQSVRNVDDFHALSVPPKYRALGDFHAYYSGERIAPYLTIFIGGNHEASNYLRELYYGGWVAPNIYYLGAANVINVVGANGAKIRIAGLSGIWKGYDYRKGHTERLPYRPEEVKTAYHVRQMDVAKLLQIQTQVDVGMSHDWPRGVEWKGDWGDLFRRKSFLRSDAEAQQLGSPAATYVLEHLRPRWWFSAHLHVKYAALLRVGEDGTMLGQGKHSRSIQHNSDHPFANGKMDHAAGAPATSTRGENETNDDAPGTVKNNEEIDLDLDEDDTPAPSSANANTALETKDESRDISNQPPLANVAKNADEIDLDLDDEDIVGQVEAATTETSAPATAAAIDTGATNATSDHTSIVPEHLRSQLPASFTKLAEPPTAPQNDTATAKKVPSKVINKETLFLALDKCLPHRDFLQLLELAPHSSNNDHSTDEDDSLTAPVHLAYDIEWLAITRALAPLHNPTTNTPSLQADHATYAPRVAEAEAWVIKHILEADKLRIPLNFSTTAPPHDAQVSGNIRPYLREYNNPQTVSYCNLLEIDNPFAASEEEIMARHAQSMTMMMMEREAHLNNRGGNRGNFSRGRGRGYGHGHGRGRGQGHGHGYGRGRGRGRGQQ